MIDKQDFVRYVEIYRDFENYLDKLANMHINIYRDSSCDCLKDAYVALLCQVMDVYVDDKYPNELESYLFERRESKSPGEFYNQLTEKE